MGFNMDAGILPSAARLRWGSGCVLLCFVSLHLCNHAMGLVSLQAAEGLRELLHRLWQSWPGTLLLYGAGALHIALALAALMRRRGLRMAPLDALRIALGLLLPLLLINHVPATRWVHDQFGVEAPYARLVAGLWTPKGAALQLGLMVTAWLHACLGLHIGLRARRGYRRWQGLLLGLALALPSLAALGFLMMGRELSWRGLQPSPALNAAQTELLGEFRQLAWALYLGLLALLLMLRGLRHWHARRGPRIRLDYPGRSVLALPGWSVLESSRAHGIAHLSLCGGRARCSTCRVRVQGPAAHCNPPGPDERRTLAQVGAGPDIRLACQLRPLGDLQVTPLLTGARHAPAAQREVVVLFVDLRRWSGFSERHWPTDLVYVLDAYFELVGTAVTESGGVANQFVGDGVMAIFGLQTDLAEASRQALRAAALIGQRMGAWRQEIEQQFGHAIDYGIGLHCGPVALGDVGHAQALSFTAIGEVVNSASRLQDYCKVAGVRMVVSAAVAESGGLAVWPSERVELRLRGHAQPLAAYCLSEPPAPS